MHHMKSDVQRMVESMKGLPKKAPNKDVEKFFGQSMSKEFAAQAESMAQLAVLTMIFGKAEDAGKLARCAAHLAGNSLRILDTGYTAEAYNVWLGDRRLPYNGKKVD